MLYDLTSTCLEGEAAANPEARHGRSKEKRSDCPLVTLGLVLDGSGFVRRSRTFAGNVSEGITLAGMLTGLDAPSGALVIMDAGIATEANLAWLIEHGYRYLVVRRAGARQFDAAQAVAIETAGGETLRIQKCLRSNEMTWDEERLWRFLGGVKPGLTDTPFGCNGKSAATMREPVAAT